LSCGVSNKLGDGRVSELCSIACSYPALLYQILSILYVTMMCQPKAFNIYLCLALLLAPAVTTGCKSTPESKQKSKDKKLAAVMRFHLETRSDISGHQEVVSILRDHPVQVTIQKTPFLNEADIADAKVIDSIGGFSLSLKFDRRGRWLLEQYSTANPGKRIAVYAQFGEGLKESRWLAAPVIRKRMGDGVFTFTPDASREETDQITKGLNNVAKKVQGKSEEW